MQDLLNSIAVINKKVNLKSRREICTKLLIQDVKNTHTEQSILVNRTYVNLIGQYDRALLHKVFVKIH